MTSVTGQMKGNLPNPFGRTLGLIHGDQHGNHSDTPTGEETTSDEERESGSSDLHGNTSNENENSEDDRPPPTEEIGGGGGEQSTDECASGQDGDDEGLLGRRDGTHPGDGIWFTEGTQPVLHSLDTSDGASIITEEDATKGGEKGLQGRQ